MTTKEVAEHLVALCREGKVETAQKQLYADDAINIEPYGTETFPQETKGLDAIIAKGRKFGGMIEEVHAMSLSDPLIAGSWFACAMHLDVTVKGKGRMQMDELCIYEVKDGKIISERFTARLDV
jgi:hypothetical protein